MAKVGGDLSKQKAAKDAVLDAVARSPPSVSELEGCAAVAQGAGLGPEAKAATAAAELAARDEAARKRTSALEAQLADAQQRASSAERIAKREEIARRDAEASRDRYDDEKRALTQKLAQEADLRRREEATAVKTLEELKVQEEARWAAERLLQQETVRANELQAALSREKDASGEAAAMAESAAARAKEERLQQDADFVRARENVVALSTRVTALEGVQGQLEQRLALEKEACAKELSRAQSLEAELAQQMKLRGEATKEAELAEKRAAEAEGELGSVRSELHATEERLRVSNEQTLAQHVEAAATEEQMATIKEQRADDQTKMIKAAAERAALIQARRPPPPAPSPPSPSLHPSPTPSPFPLTLQAAKDLERQLEAARRAAERQQADWASQRLELQQQLTEAHRRIENAQADSVRHELELQQQKQLGESQEIGGSRLQLQLEEERRARQQLAQKLAAEEAMRQQAAASAAALQKELQAKARDSDLHAQKVHAMAAELQLARADAKERQQLGEFRTQMQRERERLGGIPSGRERVGGVHTQLIPQRLRENQNSSPAELRPQPSVTPANIVSTGGAAAANQVYGGAGDLSMSGVWNFSSGEMQRNTRDVARGMAPAAGAPEVSLPRITRSGSYNTGAAAPAAAQWSALEDEGDD